jgi:thiamine biosynthesis lipoprotein
MSTPGMKLHSIKFKAMGSPCEFQLYMSDKDASKIGQNALALIKRIEDKYSRYQANSITSKINLAAGTATTIELDEETAGLIDYASVMHQQSDGLFDITSGILRKAWDFKSQKLPSRQQVEQLIPLIGWEQVEWQAPFFRLPQVGMEIDFGGYVKEYTADLVANFCMEAGVSHGLINLGGDIHVIGPHLDGTPWKLGIQHPRLAQQAIASLEISQGAIATSGDYERFMLIDGLRYSHLLNPFTGQSIQPKYSSASVIAPQCIVAGAFSTIALLKSSAEPNWLSNANLPYLLINQHMELMGSLADKTSS